MSTKCHIKLVYDAGAKNNVSELQDSKVTKAVADSTGPASKNSSKLPANTPPSQCLACHREELASPIIAMKYNTLQIKLVHQSIEVSKNCIEFQVVDRHDGKAKLVARVDEDTADDNLDMINEWVYWAKSARLAVHLVDDAFEPIVLFEFGGSVSIAQPAPRRNVGFLESRSSRVARARNFFTDQLNQYLNVKELSSRE